MENPQNFAKGAKLCATTAEGKAHRLKPVLHEPGLRLRRRASPTFTACYIGATAVVLARPDSLVEAGGMKNESLTSARTERGRDVSYRTPPLGAFGSEGEGD